MGARRAARFVFAAAVLACISYVAESYTDPVEVLKLLDLRDELKRRGLGYLLKSWTCPDDNNPTTCNPCGKNSGKDDSWGYLNGGGAWEHIACRTYDITPQEFGPFFNPWTSNVNRSGFVTTIHLTDLGLPGTLESMEAAFCPFNHLRELDVDGSAFTGPIPEWLSRCFPYLRELDLSFGQLSGTIPKWVKNLPKNLQHFKVQNNRLTGAIPAEVAQMENLHVFWAHHNDLSGTLPASLANMKHLLSFDVRYNPKLCGPLPNIRIDWATHWADKDAEFTDWFGFCDKASSENSACGVLATKGTFVGTSCAQAAKKGNETCSLLWGQCGGKNSPVIYKKETVKFDEFRGPFCCESDAKCVYRDQYYSQCVPQNTTMDLSGQTDNFRIQDPRSCGALRLLLATSNEHDCENRKACGGANGIYYGPKSCCNPEDVCVLQNFYFSQCLPPAEADAVKRQQAADAAWNAQLKQSKTANTKTRR